MKYTPVFVAGCPRSGTTMLASMMAASGEGVALPEMQFIHRLFDVKRGEDDLKQRYDELISDFRFRTLGIVFPELDFRAAVQSGGLHSVLDLIIATYCRTHGVDSSSAKFWIEHSPENVHYLERLGVEFPDAKFIHVVRDPRAVFDSMRRLPRWNIRDPLHAALLWSDSVGKFYRFQTCHRNIVLEVRYEDILLDPKGSIRSMADWLGITYDERMSSGGGIRLPKFTQAQHVLTQGPVVSSRARNWEESLKPRSADLIERALGDWLRHYGYIEGYRYIAPASRFEKMTFQMKRIMHSPSRFVRDAHVRSRGY